LRLSGQKEQVVNQAFLSLQSSVATTDAADKIEALFPGASLITKDSLYKNLSGINRLLYQSGRYFLAAIFPVALLLVIWTLKMHRLDFRYQTDILRTMGWQKKQVLLWVLSDTAVIVCIAGVIAALLSIILQRQVLPSMAAAPLLDQGFTL
jgi:ABC-type lipoprotein release transport system permease subunit